MTTLATYYILFKSNAEEVKKATGDAHKAVKELDSSTKKANEETKKLGENFTKIAEGLGQAVTAYVSFGAIKSGIINVTEFNSKLKVQSDYLGQNSQDMYAYGKAIEQVGGNAQEFQATIARLTERAQQNGQQLPPLVQLYDHFHEILSSMPPEIARLTGAQIGLDQGSITLLMQKGDAYKQLFAQMKKNAPTDADLARAREFDQQWQQTTATLQKLFTQLATDVLPTVNKLLKAFSDFVEGNPGEAKAVFEGLAVAVTAFSSALALSAVAIAANFLKIGSAASVALLPLTKIAALLGAGYLAGDAIVNDQNSIIGQSAAGRWLYRQTAKIGDKLGLDTRGAHPELFGNQPTNRDKAIEQSMKFWMGLGYTKEQAAGMVANEMAESSGNPGARGDGGKAVGLFQWHPDRQAAILRGTGIDVRTAGREDQLKAAAWELEKRGQARKLKALNDPYSSGAFISNEFEIPADRMGESIKRGRSAIDIASRYGVGPSSSNKTVNIKTGDIVVNTQATDADGIAAHINQSLQNQMRTTISNYDDGVGM